MNINDLDLEGEEIQRVKLSEEEDSLEILFFSGKCIIVETPFNGERLCITEAY